VLDEEGNETGEFVERAAAHIPKWPDAGMVAGPWARIAWRILDAQYFGLAQRRRRVFVVASARKGFDSAAVLFESQGVRRDHPPRRGEGENPAGTVAGGARRNGGYSTDDIPLTAATVTSSYGKNGGIPAGNDCLPTNLIAGTLQAGGMAAGSATLQDAEQGLLVAFGGGANCQQTDVSTALHAHPGGTRMDFETETFVVHGTQDPCVEVGMAHTLGRNNGQENAVCITGDITHTLKAEGFDASEDGTGRGQPIFACRDLAPTITSSYGKQVDNSNTAMGLNVVSSASAVRRLTPRECERLQGFPDDYTLIPWRGKPAAECPDGPRYKAIGNSKAVPVVRWIGRRIQAQLESQT
jgi:DNA (cytosine-5)-methyltransferase 1